MFKELDYLLDKKTKRYTVILFFMIILSSLTELLGIAVIYPVIDFATDDMSSRSTVLISELIGRVFNTDSKREIVFIMIVSIIIIYALKCFYVCYVYSRQFKYAATVKRDMATKLMKAYLKQPYSFFLEKNSSELIRGVNSDTSQLFQLINNILTVFSNALTALSIVILLSVTNLIMTLTIAGILSVCLALIIFVIQKKNRKNGYINQRVNGFLIKHLKQAFEGVKEIKLLNIENKFIEVYDDTYKRSTQLDVKYSIYNTMPKYLIEFFAISAVLLYLGYEIAFDPNYMKLLPQLGLFCVSAFKLLPSVNAMYSAFNAVVYYRPSIDLVYHDVKEADSFEYSYEDALIDCPEMSFKDTVKAENLSFKYSSEGKVVLDKVNFEIPRGKSVALVGPSGGGKTTTADLFLGLLQPTGGQISVDGVNIETNMWGWRKKLGYIPQTIYLLDDSIRKNVAFGLSDDEIDDERVWKALDEAQLKDFVKGLNEGLNTEVGERGARLSGGQRQRIGIARALYRNPEVLVFDEATSALDNETEREVMKAIESLQGTKTMLMIAHRLSTIENCDIVYKVEDGRITREK